MSKRIELIAKQINKDEKVLDIGTDHALLPIFLIKNNITENIIASDINELPLNSAHENLKREGLEEKVKLILTNGAKGINLSDIDVIVVAGMGATTINKIIGDINFNGRYIIHSTTHVDDVRREIQKIGHVIANEWIDIEGKIYNIIIETKVGKMSLTEREFYLGPCLMKKRKESEFYYAFLLRLLTKISKKSKNEGFKLKERKWLKEQLWNE